MNDEARLVHWLWRHGVIVTDTSTAGVDAAHKPQIITHINTY